MVGRCRGRVRPLLAQMGAAPASGRVAARPLHAGRRGRPRARFLPAALAVAALGGLGVLWVTSGQGAIIKAAGWYSAGTRPGGAAVLGTVGMESKGEAVSAVDDMTRFLPGDELGDEDVFGVDLNSDSPEAAETGGAEPGEPAEGEREQHATLVRQGGRGEEEDEGVGSPAEEVASYGGTDAGADTGAPKRGRKKKKKRTKGGSGAAGGVGENKDKDGPSRRGEGKKKKKKGKGAKTVANWFHRTRKRKKGSSVHRVLKQVNLHYTSGSFILGKQEARTFERGLGVSPVRCRVRKDKNLTRADKYCRVAKQATRFVTTDRVLDLLPDDDAAKGGRRRYGSCALVGNSGVLLQKELGEQIDRHDQVFRFNLAPTEGYEKHVGSWSSHELLNPENIRKIVAEPEKLAMLQRQGSKITVLTFDDYLQFTAKLLMKKKHRRSSREDGMHSQLLVEKHMEALANFHDAAPDVRIEYISPEFLAWSYERYAAFEKAFREFKLGVFKGQRPMSGFHTVLYLINTCEEVHLYGFSAWKRGDASPYKYFNKFEPKGGLHSFGFVQKIMEMLEEEYVGVTIHR